MLSIEINGVITFKELAEKAEATENQDNINFIRKIIINEGEDPNNYFSEKRSILNPQNTNHLQAVTTL